MKDKLTFWSKCVQSVSALDLSRARRFRPELKDVFFECLGLSSSSKVLDVGCGPGTFTRYLAKYVAPPGFICGIDSDLKFVEYAAEKAGEEGIGEYVKYVVADACALPFEEDVFDSVTSYTVIEHMADADAFIREKIRVCRPGGTVSVMGVADTGPANETALLSPLDDRINELLGKLRAVSDSIERGNTVGAYIWVKDAPKVLDRCGLKDIRISGFYTPFCIDDARYSIEEKRDVITREFIEPFEEYVRMLLSDFPEKFGDGSITVREAEELLRLTREKYDALLREIEAGRKNWLIEGGPSLIISGRKG